MKHVGEEQQDAITTLNDGAVVDYLLQHPEFFIRNAAVVEQMRVPHPVRGMVSLVEWHMARSRNYIAMLEENMSQLMEQATANESLCRKPGRSPAALPPLGARVRAGGRIAAPVL